MQDINEQLNRIGVKSLKDGGLDVIPYEHHSGYAIVLYKDGAFLKYKTSILDVLQKTKPGSSPGDIWESLK